jgi:dGTPase
VSLTESSRTSCAPALKQGGYVDTRTFSAARADHLNPRWGEFIERQQPIYGRADDPRSEFARDAGRILHCKAYRRLKNKTQLFFAASNDHICTRMEHVGHVAAISRIIAQSLGLNAELTEAIALGHDIGHAPFGHEGERILSDIAGARLHSTFWHERNSLHFADDIETIPDPSGVERNLNLTYAVRDGLICHCGEVLQAALRPREAWADLSKLEQPNAVAPCTWEGCVVKIADRIAYLGRDLEDAVALGLVSLHDVPREVMRAFRRMLKAVSANPQSAMANTTLIHILVTDLCRSSTPNAGLLFSDECADLVTSVAGFFEAYLYPHRRLGYFKKYASLIINSVSDELGSWHGEFGIAGGKSVTPFPHLEAHFGDWLVQYSDAHLKLKAKRRLGNVVVYRTEQREEYDRAVIDFISGMTDRFAIQMFGELTAFE